ncbi:MAG: AAA family ATPase [Deltaproteobacteria bacterium]|nr:AAA family ATPase [Deltaproteobacteria bacterium]
MLTNFTKFDKPYREFTPGEERFYNFLVEGLESEENTILLYKPTIRPKKDNYPSEPDFVLFLPGSGLIVFEVKDWRKEFIKKITPEKVYLGSDAENFKPNPRAQLRNYIEKIMDQLKEDSRAVSLIWTKEDKEGKNDYVGKLKFPVFGGFVFPNLSRALVEEKDLTRAFGGYPILCDDDLNKNSSISLREFLNSKVKQLFNFHLDEKEVDCLFQALNPAIIFNLPKSYMATSSQKLTLELDARHYKAMENENAPKVILTGPAGSGKTLALLNKAMQERAKLALKFSQDKVLVTCFNLSLAPFLTNLVAANSPPSWNDNLEIACFHELARSLPGNFFSKFWQDEKFMLDLANKAVPKYSSIFIDEGQDFNFGMLEMLKAMSLPGGLLWLVLDKAQNIYNLDLSYLTKLEAKEIVLGTLYRSTMELSRFCTAVRERVNAGDEKSFVSLGPKGVMPILTITPIPNDYLIKAIENYRLKGAAYGEMIIIHLYAYASLERDGTEYKISDLYGYLLECGLPVAWRSQDGDHKRSWDYTENVISLTTAHSAKGLDAKIVFIMGLEKAFKCPDSIFYAACTRAVESLEIICSQETESTKRIHNIIETLRSN